MAYDAESTILDRDPKSLTTPAERLHYLHDYLRDRVTDAQFDMGNWSSTARACCIGGWINKIWDPPSRYLRAEASYPRAGGLIGLTDGESFHLFFTGFELATSTRRLAVATLALLRQTGKVDWDAALQTLD